MKSKTFKTTLGLLAGTAAVAATLATPFPQPQLSVQAAQYAKQTYPTYMAQFMPNQYIPIEVKAPDTFGTHTFVICYRNKCHSTKPMQAKATFNLIVSVPPKREWSQTPVRIVYVNNTNQSNEILYEGTIPEDGELTNKKPLPVQANTAYRSNGVNPRQKILADLAKKHVQPAMPYSRTQNVWTDKGVSWEPCQKTIPVTFYTNNPIVFTPRQYREEIAMHTSVFTYLTILTGKQFVVTNPKNPVRVDNAGYRNPGDSTPAKGSISIVYTDEATPAETESSFIVGQAYTSNIFNLNLKRWVIPSGRVVYTTQNLPHETPRRQTTYLHEMGHVLGLAHSNSPESVMYPIPSRKKPILTEVEQQALQTLYPKETVNGCGNLPQPTSKKQ